MSGSVAALLAALDLLDSYQLGYDQDNRWAIRPGGECDCTSSTAWAIARAGYPLDLSRPFYTGAGTITPARDALKALPGWTEISVGKVKILAALIALLKPGDVLWGEGHMIAVRDAKRWWSAEHDERGRSTGGKTGRQAGEKVGYRAPYMRSRGWVSILRPPADAVSKPVNLAFRVAQASQQAPHFGGKATGAQRGREIARLGASVVGLTETQITPGAIGSAKAAALRIAIMAAIGKGWRRQAREAVCLMWDASKWSKGEVASVAFAGGGDVWHRALAVRLWRKDARTWITFVVAHVRPKSVATLTQKRADVAKAVELGLKLAAGSPIVWLGDWALDADDLLRGIAYRATASVDTYDPAGVQKIDAIYLTTSLAGSKAAIHDPGSISDHKWPSVRVTKAAVTTA